MNTKFYADKIIELSNKELEINEYRDRLIAIINEIRNEERTKHLAEGVKQYKRIDAENPIRELPERNKQVERQDPIIESYTNEARFTPDERIGEE